MDDDTIGYAPMLSSSDKSDLSTKLEWHLMERDVRAGIAILDRSLAEGLRPSAELPEDFSLLLCIAQWVDIGYRDLSFFEDYLSAFDGVDHLQLRMLQFMQLQLAIAYGCIARHEFQRALGLLGALLQTSGSSMPASMRFITLFWKARAHRHAGEFDQAFLNVRSASECAAELAAEKLVAVTKIHESWLLFHQGKRRIAFELLDEAEEVLRPTGHVLSLGNIEAARGRFVRASGDYRQALVHFENAICIYRAHYPEHPNLARAFVNAAYVKRLIALHLQPRLRGEPAPAVSHVQSIRIAREAMELLKAAELIYEKEHHQAGSGSVLVNLGHLHLESGEIDAAAEQARRAYSLGEAKRDVVLMARARILQAYVQLSSSEEQIERHPGAAHPAQEAATYAEEAISLAQETENLRLLAGAYITRGLVATDEYYADRDAARDYARKAGELLGGDDHDHLYRELGGLKLRITRSTALSDTLRRWADGDLGGKSFQQIEEEFAEIVIPKVWMKLGRNVSLVAQHLSISPKKVRRILRNSHNSEHSR